MGVRITSTGVSRSGETHSAVTHGGRAARQAMQRGGVRPEQIGVLINTGVFRDSNTVEPAVAALIQQAAGLGLEYDKGDPTTFSFDLMNGAAGVVDAIGVASAVLGAGGVEHVLIVAGDTHPSLTRAVADDAFPYATASVAILLERTDEPDGFGRVHTAAAPGDPGTRAYVDTATMGTAGRGVMTVERDADFEDRLLPVALAAARAALDDSDDPATTALIASTPGPRFPLRLAEALGLPADAVRLPDLTDGDPHTAALPLAYDRAVREQTLADYTSVLFVAAGAGPAASAVRYRLPALVGARP